MAVELKVWAGHEEASPDPDGVYEVLVAHARACRACWEVRDQLWREDRLCETGRAILVAYAQHELWAREVRSGRPRYRVICGSCRTGEHACGGGCDCGCLAAEAARRDEA
jgi:hypothetical protein